MQLTQWRSHYIITILLTQKSQNAQTGRNTHPPPHTPNGRGPKIVYAPNAFFLQSL